MSEKQDVFELQQLSSISFQCQTCGTELTFRADREDFGKGQQVSCPCCNSELVGVGAVLEAYRKLLADAKRMGLSVFLRGPKIAS